MPQPATLILAVNKFKSLNKGEGFMTTGPGYDADVNVAVTPTGTNVSVGDDGSVSVSHGTGQQINIRATGYIPVGLVFKQKAELKDPAGNDAFGQYERTGVNKDTLKVTDNALKPATYEFFVLIQDPATADFGLIDPQITNN